MIVSLPSLHGSGEEVDGVESDEDAGLGVTEEEGMPRISERAEGVMEARRLARMLRARCARGLRCQVGNVRVKYINKYDDKGEIIDVRCADRHRSRNRYISDIGL